MPAGAVPQMIEIQGEPSCELMVRALPYEKRAAPDSSESGGGSKPKTMRVVSV